MSTSKHNMLKIAVITQLMIYYSGDAATSQPLDLNFQDRVNDRTFPSTVPAPDFHLNTPHQQGTRRAIKPRHPVKPAAKPKKQS